MGKIIDMTGIKYGRLTPIRFKRENGTTLWYCKCDCGNYKWVDGSKVRLGHTTSCGCYKNIATKKHGMTKTRIHNIWCGIRYRCEYKKNDHYADYGGRGIRVCEEWHGDDGFNAFYKWAVGSGYEDGLSIDRIDVNGNYEPSNCRWVSQKEQCNNKRNNVLLTVNGETHTQTEWAEITGISPDLIHARITKLGWRVEKALKTPVRPNKRGKRWNTQNS